jgi:hypothetical protein
MVSAAMQPLFVTRSQYLPVVSAMTDGAVLPLFHRYAVPAGKVACTCSLNGIPLQLVVSGPRSTTGSGATSIWMVSDAAQPVMSVTVSQYVPDDETVIDADVVPVLHVYPLPGGCGEVRITELPAQNVVSFPRWTTGKVPYMTRMVSTYVEQLDEA